jgi:hypothetical protein
MNILLGWLAERALLIYLVCLVGSLGYAIAALMARQRRQAAQFSLERELAQQQSSRFWLMAALFLALGGVIFLVTTYLVPSLPLLQVETATPQVGLLTSTPTSTPVPTAQLTPATVTATPATGELTPLPATPLPTANPPTETPTPTPAPPPEAYQPDCPLPNAQVIVPLAGSSLTGQTEIRGTASVNSFSYYKFEVQFPDAETPSFVAQYTSPVENGILGYWDVSDRARYPAGGPYRLRLVVVDIYGNTTICIVPVNIGP